MSGTTKEATVSVALTFAFNAETLRNITSEVELVQWIDDEEVKDTIIDEIHNQIADTGVVGADDIQFEVNAFGAQTKVAVVTMSVSAEHNVNWSDNSITEENDEEDENGLDEEELQNDLEDAVRNVIEEMFESPDFIQTIL